jgi:hypothetical protein
VDPGRLGQRLLLCGPGQGAAVGVAARCGRLPYLGLGHEPPCRHHPPYRGEQGVVADERGHGAGRSPGEPVADTHRLHRDPRVQRGLEGGPRKCPWARPHQVLPSGNTATARPARRRSATRATVAGRARSRSRSMNRTPPRAAMGPGRGCGVVECQGRPEKRDGTGNEHHTRPRPSAPFGERSLKAPSGARGCIDVRLRRDGGPPRSSEAESGGATSHNAPAARNGPPPYGATA